MKREDVIVGLRVRLTDVAWERANDPIFAQPLTLSREGVVTAISPRGFNSIEVTVLHDVGEPRLADDNVGSRADWPWRACDLEPLP